MIRASMIRPRFLGTVFVSALLVGLHDDPRWTELAG